MSVDGIWSYINIIKLNCVNLYNKESGLCLQAFCIHSVVMLSSSQSQKGTPLLTLMKDPYIIIAAGKGVVVHSTQTSCQWDIVFLMALGREQKETAAKQRASNCFVGHTEKNMAPNCVVRWVLHNQSTKINTVTLLQMQLLIVNSCATSSGFYGYAQECPCRDVVMFVVQRVHAYIYTVRASRAVRIHHGPWHGLSLLPLILRQH